MKKFQNSRILVIGVLTLLLILGSVCLVMAEEDKTVSNSKGIEVGYYEEFTSEQVSALRNVGGEIGKHIAPDAKQGYIFAGWYSANSCQSDSALTNDAINTMLADDSEDKLYAKFVSDSILNVKAQLQGGIDSLSETSILRFVTTVDDLDYLEVGFSIALDGKTYTSNTETVYKRLYAVGTSDEKSALLPTEFHDGSRYFMAVNLKSIPADVFSKEATAIPYWITCDGTKVENTDVETKSVVQGMPTVCEARVTDANGDEEKYYSTLEKAFSVSSNKHLYLQSGYIVTVIQDNVEIAERLNVRANITLTNEANRDVIITRSFNNSQFVYYYTSALTVKGTGAKGEGKGSLVFDGEEQSSTHGCIESRSEDSQLILKDVSFINMLATRTGGAVRVEGGMATITDCTFTNNVIEISGTTVTKGAAIYYIHSGANTTTLTIDGCTFNSNRSTSGGGGAIYISEGVAEIKDSCFDSNDAISESGGAIYIDQGTVGVSGSRFSSNYAGSNASSGVGGGAIFTNQGNLTISDSDFEMNGAYRWGGAVYEKNGTVIIQDGCTFSNNEARRGGAMYMTQATGPITDCIFSANTALYGGAIHYALSMTIDGCVFDNNSASTDGQASFTTKTTSETFEITNTTLIEQSVGDFNGITLVTQETSNETTSAVDNIHDAGDDHQMSLLTNMDKSEFEAYCSLISSGCFELKSENEMSSSEENENIARTYYSTERGYMLHTYWVEYSKEVRTLVAKMDASMLFPLRKLSGTEEESETVSATSCTPLFHQLEALNYDDTAGIQSLEGGMGYIIRLKDGRFIIIDGGHRTETDPENPSATTNVNSDTLEILAFLAKNTPDPKNIVIASWIFTHTHSDHSGAFVNFTKYLDLHIKKVNYDFGTSIEKVTLESVMLNACDTEEQMTYCSKSGTEEILTDIIPNYWETKWGSKPVVYKPLTGQVYTFADTSIEILYTMSDFLPNTIQYEEDGNGGDYNIQSVVSIVDVDSTADKSDRFFIMGDTTAVACNEMSKRYGTYMESDYVQVAHHGYNEFNTGHLNCRRHGATQEIYEYILKDNGSTIVMWPTSDKRFADKTQTTIPINYWLVTDALVKAHWIAESVSDENRTIEFD